MKFTSLKSRSRNLKKVLNVAFAITIRLTKYFLFSAKGDFQSNFPKACFGFQLPQNVTLGCKACRGLCKEHNMLHCSKNQIRKVTFLPGQNKLLAVKN